MLPMPPTMTTVNAISMKSRPMVGKHRIDRRQQHAGETCERHAEGEGAGIDVLHRHTERSRHVPVIGRGAHHGAKPRPVNHEGNRGDDAVPMTMRNSR